MPKKVARILAKDDAVGSDELWAAVAYLGEKIDEAKFRNEPAPFLAYRNKLIFECTLKLRGESACQKI